MYVSDKVDEIEHIFTHIYTPNYNMWTGWWFALFPAELTCSGRYVSDRAGEIELTIRHQTTADELGSDLFSSHLCQHTPTGMYMIELRKFKTHLHIKLTTADELGGPLFTVVSTY